MSEKVLREVSGKRKKGERRPSKRLRMAMKAEKKRLEAENLAKEIFGGIKFDKNDEISTEKTLEVNNDRQLSVEKQNLIQNAFTPKSSGYSVIHATESDNDQSATAEPIRAKSVVEPSQPTTGRVLKASFGTKSAEKPKAVIVSAAELARQRAEERAKKIRETLLAKKMGSVASMPPAATDNGEQPVKRPRGRPRKNPLPEI